MGNGYWATRGAAPETRAGRVHYPGTYLAGIFNRLESTVQGRTVETEHMVNSPDWTYLRVTLPGGDELLPDNPDMISYRQELDLRRGLLTRTTRFRDRHGRTTRVTTRQFQSFAGHHLAALELTVEAEDWSGRATVHRVTRHRCSAPSWARTEATMSSVRSARCCTPRTSWRSPPIPEPTTTPSATSPDP